MLDTLFAVPGRIFLAAIVLPLFAFALLMLWGLVRGLRGGRDPLPSRVAGALVLGLMTIAAGCVLLGTKWYFEDLQTYADQPATLNARYAEQFNWIEIGARRADPRPALTLTLGYHIDRLSALMLSMVTVVATLIVWFSTAYLEGESTYRRFFQYLALFAFAMGNLLLADNLLQVFIGWELVGVSSFYLIGFYADRPSAARAANKAFLVNRVGDAGFLIALAVLYSNLGTFHIATLIERAQELPATDALWVGFGLLAGCLGKSAQVPLHTWLADAMEGPTPVSALIHAATMVAAGVYLVGRVYPLFPPLVLHWLAYLGLFTMLLGATAATVQTDIKRVLAYSTCSQLGFMMVALALGGWSAGLFHLLTHAFFKALLFLGAGSVIHACHHEQNLRAMGGLRKSMPITAGAMLVGVFAISGVPLLSGWYSKEAILGIVLGEAVANQFSRPLLFFVPFLSAALTSFYMARLWLLAFAGTPRDPQIHAHESGVRMTGPLIILAIFSIGVGWGFPIYDADASIVAEVLREQAPPAALARSAVSLEAAHAHHTLVALLAFALTIGGFTLAVLRHRAGVLLESSLPKWFTEFLRRAWFFDAIYDAIILKPMQFLAKNSAEADRPMTPNAGATLDGVWQLGARFSTTSGQLLSRLHTGAVRSYLLALGLTVGVLLMMLLAR